MQADQIVKGDTIHGLGVVTQVSPCATIPGSLHIRSASKSWCIEKVAPVILTSRAESETEPGAV